MAFHEEINDKSISLAARVGKVSAGELRKILEKLIADLRKKQKTVTKAIKTKNAEKANSTPEIKRGRKTLKQLSQQNDGLSTVELKDPDLRLLNQTMKKHNVDFACMKDGKGKYTLFFKGRDADTITHTFQQYTQKVIKRAKGNSINKTLAAAKEMAQNLNAGRDRAKSRDKGARDI